MAGKSKWSDKNYALRRLENFLKENKTLQGMSRNGSWNNIRTMCNRYNYNVQDLCEELGYDYLKLKGVKIKLLYLKNPILQKITNIYF